MTTVQFTDQQNQGDTFHTPGMDSNPLGALTTEQLLDAAQQIADEAFRDRLGLSAITAEEIENTARHDGGRESIDLGAEASSLDPSMFTPETVASSPWKEPSYAERHARYTPERQAAYVAGIMAITQRMSDLRAHHLTKPVTQNDFTLGA